MHHTTESIAFVKKETIVAHMQPFIEKAHYPKHYTGLEKSAYFTPIGEVSYFELKEKAALHQSGLHFLGQVLLLSDDELDRYNGTFKELQKKIRTKQKEYSLSAKHRERYEALKLKFRDCTLGEIIPDMGILYWFAYHLDLPVCFSKGTKIGDQTFRSFMRNHSKAKSLSLQLRLFWTSLYHDWIARQNK